MRVSGSRKLASMFLDRWSPRSFLSDPLSEEEIEAIFEAARWSPSCFNEQPWRFVFARTVDDLKSFQSVLVDANRVWAATAPLLMIAFSRRTFRRNEKANRWSQFDTGAAWMALALQANQMGLHCHAMGGFDKDKAYEVANVDPEKYEAICMIVIGKKGEAEALPDDLKAREEPSDREPITGLVFEGRMPIQNP